ncbi:unnamed protein product [Prunus brigantina]
MKRESGRRMRNGLRLPLHPFVQRWMAFLGVAPHQMNPNLLRTILCMFVLWKRHHGIEPSTNILRCCFDLRKSPKQTGGELTEDEEGQLEVIRALEASARDATELLSHSSLSASGLLDPVTEGNGEARSPGRGRGQDRGKRPVGEEKEAPGAKRPRVEEVEEVAVGPTPAIHPERLADFVDTTRMVLSGEMSWEGLTLGESTYASSTAMAFEQSVRALFSHYGAVRRVMIHREKDVARVAELRRNREEAGKRDAEVKAVVDRAKRMTDESTRKEKALENACKPQVGEVKSFLESEEGAELAGEVRLSGGLDLLEKIQKRYPDFVFSLEDLLGEDEDTGRGDPEPTPSMLGIPWVGEGLATERGEGVSPWSDNGDHSVWSLPVGSQRTSRAIPAELAKSCVVKLAAVVRDQDSGYSEPADDVFPHEALDAGFGNGGEWLGLSPLGEDLRGHGSGCGVVAADTLVHLSEDLVAVLRGYTA